MISYLGILLFIQGYQIGQILCLCQCESHMIFLQAHACVAVSSRLLPKQDHLDYLTFLAFGQFFLNVLSPKNSNFSFILWQSQTKVHNQTHPGHSLFLYCLSFILYLKCYSHTFRTDTMVVLVDMKMKKLGFQEGQLSHHQCSHEYVYGKRPTFVKTQTSICHVTISPSSLSISFSPPFLKYTLLISLANGYTDIPIRFLLFFSLSKSALHSYIAVSRMWQKTFILVITLCDNP